MAKKRALLNVDYTWDFVAEEGALTCGAPGQNIEQAIVAITKEFIEQDDYVIFAIDIHKEGDELHPETKLFPPHNVEGTEGRHLYGELAPLFEANKHRVNVDWMDKTRYSVFAGTDLELRLRARGITEIHLVGVCTDICILHSAIDAYNKGFDIVIHEQGVASFNQAGHDWALTHFKNTLGAKVV